MDGRRKTKILGWLLAALLSVLPGVGRALDPTLQLSQYVVDNWELAEGLPQSSVAAIARTPDGYLWVGTQEGLARFDGVRFVTYDGSNVADFPNKYITTLLVDHAGKLWVGSWAGIAVVENGRVQRYDKDGPAVRRRCARDGGRSERSPLGRHRPRTARHQWRGFGLAGPPPAN